MLIWTLLAFIIFAASWYMIYWIQRNAHHFRLIESPNNRSSHEKPTAKGGGIGIVISSSCIGLVIIFYTGFSLFWVGTLMLSLLIAVTGLFDDFNPLSIRIRFMIQVLICTLFIILLGDLPAIHLPYGLVLQGWWLNTLIIFFGVWWLNLFNFMDGIDGLAASQSVFMLLVGGGLLSIIHTDNLLNFSFIWMFGLAIATLGFLFHNWPPAKIFMGDTGSMYLSFMIYVFALSTIPTTTPATITGFTFWLILAAVFIADASITLVTRMVTNQRWYEAHRSHAYQRLTRKLGNHRSVTILIIVVDICWLTPLAWASIQWPNYSLEIAVLAYLPLAILAWKLGAGRPGDI